MKISYGVLLNNRDVFEEVLLRSPIKGSILAYEGDTSATKGLNTIIERSKASDILVFAHQDVFFPVGWEPRLIDCIQELPENWGVLGVWGINEKSKFNGNYIDIRYQTGNGATVGCTGYSSLPEKALCLDEICLIINNKVEFKFDEELTGWDLYGTYASLRMREMGKEAIIINNKVIHVTKRSFAWKPDGQFIDKFEWLKNRFPNQKVLSTVYQGETV